jgi:rare lipoprotein A
MPWRPCRAPEWPAGIRTLLYCLLVTNLLTSCTRPHVPPLPLTPPAPSPSPPDRAPVPALQIESGTASWYGRERQGRRTANGEMYDSEQLTAAHRTAPFGTYARVTNLANGRTVWVRINDRGPAIAKHVLDLSYAAARQLGMVRAGITRVNVEFLAPGLMPPPSS